jgi:hypothetical protein
MRVRALLSSCWRLCSSLVVGTKSPLHPPKNPRDSQTKQSEQANPPSTYKIGRRVHRPSDTFCSEMSVRPGFSNCDGIRHDP